MKQCQTLRFAHPLTKAAADKGQIFAIKTGIPVLLIFEKVLARQANVLAGKHLSDELACGDVSEVLLS